MTQRGDAKDLLRESKKLAAKARGLDPEVVSELATAQRSLTDLLADRAADKDALAEAAGALDQLVTKHLGHLRKGRAREYAESIGVAVGFALLLRAFALEAFQIPTGSMEPTLLVGDHLFVSKSTYGLRVPFTTRYLYEWGTVERGDIVVFVFPVPEVATQRAIGEVARRVESYALRNGGYPTSLDDAGVPMSARTDGWGRPFQYALEDGSYVFSSAGADGRPGTADDLNNRNAAFVGGSFDCLDEGSLSEQKDYIKRVVGIPGDRVALRDGVLIINDEPVPRSTPELTEDPVYGRMVIHSRESIRPGLEYDTWSLGLAPNFDEIEVREGHFFVMGDNRDNSSDGRCWGQVPLQNVKGESMFIFFSRDRRPASRGGASNWVAGIRWSRFFQAVR